VHPGKLPLYDKEARNTFQWQRNFHCLHYSPNKRYPYILHEEVGSFVLANLSRTFSKETDIIAYKGGDIERQLCEKLGIRSINLECLGCPKFEVILRRYPETEQLANYHNCMMHVCERPYWYKERYGDSFPHCAASEIAVFSWWVNNVLRRVL
jgi:hypothetical protein